ncbi:MAG: YckD family protein [Peptococcaceae bacterium]|nr:YckD family protein [Peptococcaceae bacterium]
MRKRYVVMAAAGVLALVILVPGAFAAVTGNQDNADWFNRMFDYHKQWVNQAVESGRLTPEQGEAWNRHFDQMKEFHAQNGYYCPGFGGGMMGNFNGNWYGGMMGGFGGPVRNGSNQAGKRKGPW